ncbi:S8 family serine peptidase [Intrasporangium sp. DVR]|uniref:S8 family serine peptidase n=1 Tax=Intrasporangium sp. DVR TaxID=3127867 RepID=UPI00313A64DB
MRSNRALAVTATAALALSLGMAASSAAQPEANTRQSAPEVDSSFALVRLASEPLATNPRTAPEKGKKIGFANQAVKAERDRIRAEQTAFKDWLRVNAPKARVTKQFDVAVNAVGVQLNGTSLSTVRSAPGVTYAELQGVFTPLAHEDPDLELVDALEGWTAVGGAAEAGKGVKVAIIDSGIDVTHPCFDDTGYPAVTPLGDAKYTNNKVIVSRTYGNKVAKNGFDGRDLNGHGTHVAGTVACNAHTSAVVDGTVIPYAPSGVAPAATLGSYNVFPGTAGSARSEDILEAMQDAYVDGFDVANMSLGGARNDGGGAFLLDNAVDNLDRANMVVAVAAGNEGPGYWTVHYPGAAPRALTAGASTVGHALVNTVTVAGTDYDVVVGDFGKLTEDITAPLAVAKDAASGHPLGLSLACNGSPLPNLAGKIAVIGRNVCTFQEKIDNVTAAGAVAAIVVNREDALLTMAGDQSGVVSVMVTKSDGAQIMEHDGQDATINANMLYKSIPEATNRMASFSSQGPTHGDLLIKPDVVAPGADVLSAQPAWACGTPPCWAIFGGTSMATPHLAGIAAVVRGDHPDWSAAEVRSAVVNTAKQGVLRDALTDTVTNDALKVGAGLADTDAALASQVALDPVSLSFGAISSGSGRSVTKSLVITNTSGAPISVGVAVANNPASGVTYSVSGGTATLAAGASTTVAVTASSAKGAADGFYQAQLNVSVAGTVVSHGMLFNIVGSGVAAPGQHQVPPGQS